MISVATLNGIFSFILIYLLTGFLNTVKLLFILTLQPFILLNSPAVYFSFQLILLDSPHIQSQSLNIVILYSNVKSACALTLHIIIAFEVCVYYTHISAYIYVYTFAYIHTNISAH